MSTSAATTTKRAAARTAAEITEFQDVTSESDDVELFGRLTKKALEAAQSAF